MKSDRQKQRRPSDAAGVALLLLALAPRDALAMETEVTATTAAQGYALRSPFGDPVLLRRRVMQTLGLGVYQSLGEEQKPNGPQIQVKLRLRLDADIGIDSNETGFTRGDASSRYVPGLREAPIDLMYGYVEGRNLAGGWLGFRLGRQYQSNALGWWGFDGGLVRVQAPYVHVELYGGFEQRGGMPLSLGRYERNGVWRGDRSGLDGSPDAFPMFLEAGKAPAFGAAIESNGPHWIHGRLDYRRVYNTGEVTTSYMPDANGQFKTTKGTRTSSERLGYAIDGTVGDYGAGKGGMVYDLYSQFFSAYYLNLDGFIGKRVTVGADYDYFRPTFDGDSIFNWFTQSPITTLTGRGSFQATERLDLAVNGGVRWWETDDDPSAPTVQADPGRVGDQGAVNDPKADKPTRLTDVMGSLYGRYRWDTGKATLRGVLEIGDRGRREGVDAGGERYFRGGKYGVSVRGSVYDFRDDLRPDRSATSIGYVVGGSWRPSQAADVMLEWEHNTNKLVGQRFRLLALLNVAVSR